MNFVRRQESVAVPHDKACHPERSGLSAKRTVRRAEGPLPQQCGLWLQIQRVRCLAVAVLREIFDEVAYERFLVRNQQTKGRETYAAFRRDHEAHTARRHRCC